MPEHVAEDGAFLALLVGGHGGDHKTLGVDHLAHDAAGGVGCGSEDGVEAQLLGGDLLQATEEHVRGRVTAREGHTQPAQHGAEEGEEHARAGEGQTHGGVQTRRLGHEAQGQHGGDGEQGDLHAADRATPDLDELQGTEAGHEATEDARQHEAGAGEGEPVEGPDGGFRGGLGDHGGSLDDHLVEAGHLEGLDGDAIEEVGLTLGAAVQEGLDLRGAPGEHEEGQEDPGQPGLEDLAAGLGHMGSGDFRTLVLVAPDGLGLPDLQEQNGGGHGDDGADDVHQPGAVVVADGELGNGEATTRHEAGGPDFQHGLATSHGPNDPEGDDEGEDGQDAASGGAEQVQGQARDASEGDERATQGAVGDGGGVADEGQAGGLEGAEAEADEHGRRDRNGRAEAGSAFNEGTEAEGDEEGLDAAIRREACDGVLDHLEVT